MAGSGRARWVVGSALVGGAAVWAVLRFGAPVFLADERHDARPVLEALSWIAGIAALALGVVSTAQALRSHSVDGRRTRTAQAQALLTTLAGNEALTLARLLGDTGNPRPADLGFVRHTASGAPSRADGGAAAGSLGEIAAYYRSLELGRMVVLGEAGAGKTVMVLRLLLDLAGEALAALDVEPRTKVRVPVRLSLSSFHVEPEVLEPTALRTRLDSWIARQLTRAHGIPHGQARALVSEGWVLPVLDGLDEMAPSRVEQLVAALNCPVGPTPGPVVLTSRTTAYVERVERSGKAAIEDVTVVTVRPLDIESVVAWLAHRFPDPARPDRVQQRWRRVVTTIRRHPGGRLARCLISPLNLYLATAVYADPHSTPAKLCDHDTGDPTRHLLDHLIPAVARHHPGSDGSHYRPDQVRTWLTTITRHLEVMARSGYSGTDFHLHHLWMSVGRSGRWIRLPVAAIVTVPVIGALALVVAPVLTSGTGLPARALTMALAAGFLAVVVLEARSPKLGVLPRLALPRLRDPKARSRVAYAIVMGILAGLATGLVQGAVIGTVVGAAVSQLAALLFGLFSATPQAQRPSDTLRAAIAYTITLGLSAASLFALVGGLALGVPHGTAVGLVTAVTIALAIGTGFGVAPYSPNLPGVWLVRYVLAVGVLHRRGLLPRHPQRFLDWAHTAGLLRLAGTAAQFRHRTIQTLLATVPEHPSEGFH